MKKHIAAIAISVLLPAFISLITSYILNEHTVLKTNSSNFSVIFYIVLFGTFCSLSAGFRNKPSFTGLLIGGIVVRLLLALTVIVIYMAKGEPDFFSFSVHFIIHYILFSVFEIRYLLRLIHTIHT